MREIPLEQLCGYILEAYCERRMRCFSEAALEYQGYATVNGCVEALAPFCNEECDREQEPFCGAQAETWQPSIAARRLSYHPEQAFDCFEALRETRCMEHVWETFGPLVPEPCKGVLEGQVAPGGECTFWTLECEGEGMWCRPNGWPTLGCKSGTCQQMGKVGDSCNMNDGEICEFGTDCTRWYGGDGVCVKHGELGDACDIADTVACKTGLFCGSDTKCAETALMGEPCDDSNGDPCDMHSYCDGGVCVGLPKAGEACGGDRPTHNCWLGWCEVPAGHTEGTCMPLPTVGAECSDETSTWCLDGYCDWNQAPPMCVAFKALEQYCETNGECESLVCHPVDMVCVEEYCPEE